MSAASTAAPAIRPEDFLDIDHLLSDEELIARAFQQYVAHKRGGELLTEHFRDVTDYGMRFQAFPDDEIERIEKAFDKWMEAILP